MDDFELRIRQMRSVLFEQAMAKHGEWVPDEMSQIDWENVTIVACLNLAAQLIATFHADRDVTWTLEGAKEKWGEIFGIELEIEAYLADVLISDDPDAQPRG